MDKQMWRRMSLICYTFVGRCGGGGGIDADRVMRVKVARRQSVNLAGCGVENEWVGFPAVACFSSEDENSTTFVSWCRDNLTGVSLRRALAVPGGGIVHDADWFHLEPAGKLIGAWTGVNETRRRCAALPRTR